MGCELGNLSHSWERPGGERLLSPPRGGGQWVLPRTFQTGVGRAPSQRCGEGGIADLPPPRACPVLWGFHSRGSSLMEQSSLIPSRTFFSEGPPSLALQVSHLAKRDLLEPHSSPRAIAWLALPALGHPRDPAAGSTVLSPHSGLQTLNTDPALPWWLCWAGPHELGEELPVCRGYYSSMGNYRQG